MISHANVVDLDPASRDILFNDRFAGDIQVIKPVTNVLDKLTIWFVSICGFCIILLAMIKHVLSACVCLWYKFFLKVHTLKTNGGETKNAGMFTSFFVKFFPDLLPWVDDEVGMKSPKDYFVKAIPEAVLSVFIGSFIFSAYYRETIGNFSVLGLHVWNRLILSHDYRAAFDRVVDSGTDYDFKFDRTHGGKNRAKIAKKIYDVVRAAYGTINDTDAKAQLGAGIESKIASWSEMNTFLDSEDYSMTFQVSNTNTSKQPELPANSTAGEVKTFNYAFVMNEVIPSDNSTAAAKEHYVKVQVAFKSNKFNPLGSTANRTASLTIDGAVRNNIVKLPTNKDTEAKIGMGTGQFTDPDGTIVNLIANGDELKIEPLDKKAKFVAKTGTYTSTAGKNLTYQGLVIKELTINHQAGKNIADVKVNVDGKSYPYGEKIDLVALDKEKAGTKKDGEGGEQTNQGTQDDGKKDKKKKNDLND